MWTDANVMAAQLNIGGALCESSVISFLVARCKVWLMPIARVSCSNTVNIGERKTWTQSELCSWQNSLRGQEPPPKKMYIQCIPAQEMAKHPAKFGWPLVSDIPAVNEGKTRNS